MLKGSTSATTNPNRATKTNDSDCKSLIQSKLAFLSSNAKSDHQNIKGNKDSNDHRLVDACDDDEENTMLFCKKQQNMAKFCPNLKNQA